MHGIVMTTVGVRSYSPLQVTNYYKAFMRSMTHRGAFTKLYAGSGVLTSSAGNVTPVWARISVSNFAVVRLTAMPG